VTGLAYAPDGKSLATAGKDGVIRLWDPTAFKPAPRVEVKAAGAVHVVLLTADTLISVADGPRVTHWDPFAGKPLREWEVPGGPATAVAITVDGRYLAAGTAGGTVGVYRVAEKRA
jgi:WD40 repeat protein